MAEATERGIVVRGEATVRRVPDMAVVTMAVTVQDKDAGRARDPEAARAAMADHLKHVERTLAEVAMEQATGEGLEEQPAGGERSR